MNKLNKVRSFVFSECAKEKPDLEKQEGVETVEEFLKRKYLSRYSFGHNSLQKSGQYLLAGWQFDFKPFLKRYVVNQYGQFIQYYEPNKALLRKSLYGRVEEIIEDKK